VRPAHASAAEGTADMTEEHSGTWRVASSCRPRTRSPDRRFARRNRHAQDHPRTLASIRRYQDRSLRRADRWTRLTENGDTAKERELAVTAARRGARLGGRAVPVVPANGPECRPSAGIAHGAWTVA